MTTKTGASPQETPAGWRLVPCELTEAMRQAGQKIIDLPYNRNSPYQPDHTYKAMLAAAPVPEDAPPKDKE